MSTRRNCSFYSDPEDDQAIKIKPSVYEGKHEHLRYLTAGGMGEDFEHG